jgi:hypothetical protein
MSNIYEPARLNGKLVARNVATGSIAPGYGLVILSGLGAFVVALLCFVGIVLGIDLAERLNDKLDY